MMDLPQIFTKTLSLALRIAVILAVCGLSAAQAGAAMHAKLCASEVQVDLNQQGHNHSQQSVNQAPNGHTHAVAASDDQIIADNNSAHTSDAGQFDPNQSDCCKSFCSGASLLHCTPLDSQFDGKALLNAFIVQQLEPAAAAAIFTPPNA